MTNDHEDDTSVIEELQQVHLRRTWDETGLDAAYVPIRSFSDWANIEIDHEAWQNYLDEYRASVEAAGPEVARSVDRRLGREAAAETGAVENLYALSVGQTRTIAIESPGWEQALDAEGLRALDAFHSQLEVYEYVREAEAEDRPITAAGSNFRLLNKARSQSGSPVP